MIRPKKLADPSWPFVQSLMSLYLSEKVEPFARNEAVDSLPPKEALVLGVMCLTNTYNSSHFQNLLYRKYRIFDAEECGVMAETGILGLVERGYLKPASKKAADALKTRDDEVWGLGDVPFVVTAKGAKRVGYLVANLRGEDYKDVVRRLQADSKDAASNWVPS